MSSFKDLRIVDNFYQTSSYIPMPTVMLSTLAEDGSTSVGSYSLCFPYYIAGKGYYAMILEARNSSNTAQHLLAGRKQVAINFMPEGRGYHKKIVAQGWPGDTPAEKMKNFGFTLEDGLCIEADPSTPRPKVVAEAYQVFECTWVSELENADEDIGRKLEDGCYPPPYKNFNGITSQYGAHFILRIDKVLMKPKFYDNIINRLPRQQELLVRQDPAPRARAAADPQRHALLRPLRGRPHRSRRPLHRRRAGDAAQRPAHLPADGAQGLRGLGQGARRDRGHGRGDEDHQRQARQGKGQGLKGGACGRIRFYRPDGAG